MSSNKKINQVRTGAVLSYINMAIGSLIPMFYTPIMLQLLGQSEYGLYKLSSYQLLVFDIIWRRFCGSKIFY